MKFCRACLLLAAIAATDLLADQSDPALPGLFDELLHASDPSAATALESRVWQLWLKAPDDDSGELLTGVVAAMQRGEMSAALELSNRLVEEHAEFAEGWNKRATVHYLMGNHDRSVSDISETLSREPRHFGAISGLGLIFMQRGDFEAALDAFEQVLAISPQSLNARRNAENVRNELGREI